MKTITLTVSNRPQYLEKCLECLSQCHGLEEYKLFIGLEPICEESRRMCENISFIEKEIIYNPTKLGVKINPFNLLNNVFNISNFNVYLEEDIMFSPDILKLANWFYEDGEKDVVLNIHNYQSIDYATHPDHVVGIHPSSFMAFAWAIHKPMWTKFSNWWNIDPRGWDWSVRKYMEKEGTNVIAPHSSRCNHIGSKGTHMCAELDTFKDRSYYKGIPISSFIRV